MTIFILYVYSATGVASCMPECVWICVCLNVHVCLCTIHNGMSHDINERETVREQLWGIRWRKVLNRKLNQTVICSSYLWALVYALTAEMWKCGLHDTWLLGSNQHFSLEIRNFTLLMWSNTLVSVPLPMNLHYLISNGKKLNTMTPKDITNKNQDISNDGYKYYNWVNN